MALVTLVLLLASLSQHCVATDLMNRAWISGYDDLKDYEALSSHQTPSSVQCTALASRLSGVQLVTYNSSTAVCRVYKCRLALSSCRKCRNLINTANKKVWVPSSIAASPCWTTVQHRVTASVSFARNWAAYKMEFGDGPNGNYWIGLDSLYSLTSVSGGRKLMILIKAWNGSESWAQYSSFSVGPEADNYRLSLSGFTSSHPTFGDSLGPMTGTWFSTADRDNDGMSSNVAQDFHGAWWFNSLSKSHLNGLYQTLPTALNTPYGQGLMWLYPFGPYYSPMESEMLIL